MHWIEVKLGRKLVWIVCDLHTGELPLRKLFTDLDGQTVSGNKWAGEIGKLLDTATEFEVNFKFPQIVTHIEVIDISSEIVRDLSTDQSYAYKIWKSITSGVLDPIIAKLEIGPLCH